MRWYKHGLPGSGDRRTVRRFLFWPHTIAGQTRWLEWAKIEQKHENYLDKFFGISYYGEQWDDVAWGN
jgi:hypothetical protein